MSLKLSNFVNHISQNAEHFELLATGMAYECGYDTGINFLSASQCYLQVAKQGDSNGQFAIGRLHGCQVFEGTSQEYATKWLDLAASQGHAAALYLQRYGYGWQTNVQIDVKKIRSLALSGDRFAAILMSFIFGSGVWVARDSKISLEWYAIAMTEGVHEAYTLLGYLYLNGNTGVQNIQFAKQYLEQAIDLGSTNAHFYLGALLLNHIKTKPAERAAVEHFMAAARMGHVEAQIALAECHALGWGVAKNQKYAETWYKKAASSGSVDALFFTASFYNNHPELNVSPVEYAMQSISLGDNRAMPVLSDYYRHCDGASSDECKKKSYYWLIRAARSGDPESKYNLGLMYKDGYATNINPARALRWVSASAADGYIPAISLLGAMYCDGYNDSLDVEKGMSLLRCAVDEGNDADALFTLGNIFTQGKIVEKNNDKAMFLLHEAAIQGHKGALLHCGLIYLYGFFDVQDDDRAFYYLERSNWQEDPIAAFVLGVCYRDGIGTSVNMNKAFSLFKFSSDKKFDDAYNAMGMMYQKGHVVDKDLQQALYWFTLAAEAGFAEGQYNLAVTYHRALGVSYDIDKALYWYRQAGARMNRNALNMLFLLNLRGIEIPENKAAAFAWLNIAISNGSMDYLAEYNLVANDLSREEKEAALNEVEAECKRLKE